MTPENIRQMATAFQQSRIILTGFELGIFTLLDEKPLSSREVAELINADERATDRLLNALTALNFLIKKDSKFSNSESSSQYLVKGKPEYMGTLHHSGHLWNSWHNLTQSVIEGHAIDTKEINNRNEDWLNAFIAAMHWRGEDQAAALAETIDLQNVNKLLDVGGGSGAFTMGFINKNPNIKGTIFDLPNVIPITKRYVDEAGMLDKINFIPGNYLNDYFGSGYDLIFLSSIIHINSPEENEKLVKKCYDALNENGRIMIQDFVMDESRTEPAFGTIFSLNMLVGTEHGDTYTENEIKGWFTKAGFINSEKISAPYRSDIMIAQK